MVLVVVEERVIVVAVVAVVVHVGEEGRERGDKALSRCGDGCLRRLTEESGADSFHCSARLLSGRRERVGGGGGGGEVLLDDPCEYSVCSHPGLIDDGRRGSRYRRRGLCCCHLHSPFDKCMVLQRVWV